MAKQEDAICPGCCATLPPVDGPTHRYIGASPACWAIFSALVNGDEPPLAPSPFNGLIGDAYAAQHPGIPSVQAIQSVAVHLLTLHGVLRAGVSPNSALWIRRRALGEGGAQGKGRFRWLTPPDFAGALTVAAIASAPTPDARASTARNYVEEVLQRWQRMHGSTIAAWYAKFILNDLPISR